MGRIFDPTQFRRPWMFNYAQNPNILLLDDRLRVFFTCRPERDSAGNCVSLTAFVDLEKSEPFKIIGLSDQPVLELGNPGDFDEFGIMPGSIVPIDDNVIYLYYVGWTRMYSVPYEWSNGLAISTDSGKSFRKYSKGPIMGATFDDPYLQACPRVHKVSPNEFVMWYNSDTACLFDGTNWSIYNPIVLPTIVEKECQTSSSFISFNGQNHLFFSFRHGIDFRNQNKGYRIGYAVGEGFENWARVDHLSDLSVSRSGWDSEMVCYPHVVEIDKQIYMFYCGNNFGQQGFGVARLDNV